MSWWLILGILFLGQLLSTQALAAKRVAFVVGISTYDHLGEEQQLANPVHDAEAMARTLTTLGFEVVSGIDLTITEFDTKWQQVLNQLTGEDTLVFFFSGHGVEVDGENLLLPRDVPYFRFGRHTQFKRQSISVTQLLQDLRLGDRSPPQVTVMIFDACRDNPTIPAEFKSGGGAPQGGLVKDPKVRGTFLMYAAEAGKVSMDRFGPSDRIPQSVYTRTLLPLLQQPNLSIQDLAIQVKEQVFKKTTEYGFEQLPEYTDGLIGRFCLAGCQMAVTEEPEAPPVVTKIPVPASAPTVQREAKPHGLLEPEMVRIPGGTFTMGSNDGYKYDRPPHQVVIQDFLLGKYEVTFAEYDQFAQATGKPLPEDEGWGRGQRPVINVSWDEAKAYAVWLSKSTGKKYRLPTEAEWEYAAWGGSRQQTWAGTSDESQLGTYAVYTKNSGGKTAEVGSKQPNAFGLHDLSGNVYEWVEDCWHENYKEAPDDGTAWLEAASGECGQRVVRGGSWFHNPDTLRSSTRGRTPPDYRFNFLGFRLAQDAP